MSPSRRDDGADVIFGPLETRVMEILWRAGSATPRQVRDALGADNQLAYTTVMTVMSRLFKKGILQRQRLGRAFRYTPKWSKAEFLGRKARSSLSQLWQLGVQPSLSHFVEAAHELDDDQLAELETEIARLREGRS